MVSGVSQNGPIVMELPVGKADTLGMDWSKVLVHTLVYSLPAVAALYVTVGVRLLRQTDGRKIHSFSLLMFAAAIYSLGYFLELQSGTLEVLLAVRNFELFGAIFLPAVGFLFVAELTGRRWGPVPVVFLVLVSLGLWLLLVTNPLHALFYRKIGIAVGTFSVPVTEKGPGYFGFLAWVGVFLIGSSLLLFRAWKAETAQKRRKSLGFVLLVFQIPWGALLIILVGADAWVDPVPPAIMLVCLLFLVNELSNDMFELQIKRWRRLFEGVAEAAFLLDKDGNIQESNAQAARLIGVSVPQTLDSTFSWTGPDGTLRWFEASKNLYDPERQLTSCLLVDVTERKQAEERLKAHLAEKDLILREVHHRIKNNMGNIMALFTLQAMNLKEPSAIEALEDASSRVQSMMVLYDKLYLSNDYTQVSTAQYFPSLIDEILENFPSHQTIRVEKAIDDFLLDNAVLQPLGIIINELLTNIMKYAFKGRESGTIQISLTRKEGRITLILRDNGNGMPETVDFEHSTGFGLQLLATLTQHLRGTIQIGRTAGTTITLNFPG